MSAHDNGGPAFPLTRESSMAKNYEGMSLRDWFAGQALAGLLAQASGEDPHKAPGLAYALANAMLRERAKAKGQS